MLFKLSCDNQHLCVCMMMFIKLQLITGVAGQLMPGPWRLLMTICFTLALTFACRGQASLWCTEFTPACPKPWHFSTKKPYFTDIDFFFLIQCLVSVLALLHFAYFWPRKLKRCLKFVSILKFDHLLWRVTCLHGLKPAFVILVNFERSNLIICFVESTDSPLLLFGWGKYGPGRHVQIEYISFLSSGEFSAW